MIDIETTEAFLKVFDYLADRFGIIVDSTNKDIIPYLQTLGDKIIAYEKSIALMWIIVGAVLAILSLIIFFIGCANNWEVMHWLWLFCGVGLGAYFIINNMYTYIGCVTFEEKIIIEYIDEVMKTINGTQTYR